MATAIAFGAGVVVGLVVSGAVLIAFAVRGLTDAAPHTDE